MNRHTWIIADSLHTNGVIVINNFRPGTLVTSHETDSPAREDPGIAIEAHASRALNRIELFLDH